MGIALCVLSLSISAAEFETDDSMMQKLFEFHSKLAKQGNLESVTRLGVMYERGEGVAKNRDKAIELYRYAVDSGYKPANELLTNILANKKSNIEPKSTLDTIRVPTPKTDITKENSEELQAKLEQEKAAAAAAREELDKMLEAKRKEEEKQQRLQQEIQDMKRAQEQLALERAKAEEIRREMERLRKQHEAELETQKLMAKKSQEQPQSQAQKTEQPPAATEAENKTDKTTFSSNPCNTPAAKFMSTCN